MHVLSSKNNLSSESLYLQTLRKLHQVRKYFYPLQWAVIDNCTDTIKWKYDSFGSVYFTKSVFLILKKYDIPDVNLFDRVKLRAWSPLLPGSEVKYFRPSIDDAKASLKVIGSYLVIGCRCLFFLLKLKKTYKLKQNFQKKNKKTQKID